MKLLLFYLLSFPAQAATWELCLDKADFTLNADTFVKSSKVTKEGCKIRFSTLGKGGEKFEIDVCNSDIHIKTFPALDSSLFTRVGAGSSNCPLPLFGADFEDKGNDAAKFSESRTKILAIYQEILHVYAEHLNKFDHSRITEKNMGNSEVQVVCTKSLIEDYLNRCTSFEEKKYAPKSKVSKK